MSVAQMLPYELRQLIERSAEAWLEFCFHVEQDSDLDSVVGILHALDGGTERTGLCEATYGVLLRGAVARLRASGRYVRCRATAEAIASAAQERQDREFAARTLGRGIGRR